jgi:hypothetical protein
MKGCASAKTKMKLNQTGINMPNNLLFFIGPVFMSKDVKTRLNGLVYNRT